MTRTLSSIALTLALLPLACSTSGEDGKAAKPDAKADQAKTPDADKSAEGEDKAAADGAEQAEAAPPAGYDAYLLTALQELPSGEISQAETQPYGCSVKYAEAAGEASAKVGEAAPEFSLPNTEGEAIALADFKGKTVVLEWFNPDCPFVVYAHEGEGPLVELGNEKTQEGVVWLAINSGAPGKQGAGAERNKQAKADWKIDYPILIDEDGKVGQAYGAKTTPHMYVIDPEGKLVYAGGLDNAPLGRVEG